MTDTKATPGPWVIEPVFMAPHGTHFGEYRFPHQAVDGHSREYPRDEAEANARLIAAAPEMIDALLAYQRLDEQRMKCEECSESLDQAPEACSECFRFADDARLKMRAAIAKAVSG